MKYGQRGDAASILLVVVIAAAIVGAGWYVLKQRTATNKAALTAQPAANSNTMLSPLSAPLAGGTDNQALSADLQNINNSLNQDNQALQNSSNSLNDQQQPITE